MSVLLECVYVDHVFAWYPWKSEEDIKAPGTELQTWVAMCWELNLGFLQEHQVALTLNHWAISLALCFPKQGFSVQLWLSWNYVDQAGLELSVLPASTSLVQGLKVCATVPSSLFYFELHLISDGVGVYAHHNAVVQCSRRGKSDSLKKLVLVPHLPPTMSWG